MRVFPVAGFGGAAAKTRATTLVAAVGALARSGITAMPFLMRTTLESGADLPSQAEVGPWKAFVRAAVARYGSNGEFWRDNPSLPYRPITIWEVWNEPNLPRAGLSPVTKPADYASLLAASAGAIRSTDPAAKVMAAGLADGTSAGAIPATKFLAGLYRAGVRKKFDIVGIHPYSPPSPGRSRRSRVSDRR